MSQLLSMISQLLTSVALYSCAMICQLKNIYEIDEKSLAGKH